MGVGKASDGTMLKIRGKSVIPRHGAKLGERTVDLNPKTKPVKRQHVPSATVSTTDTCCAVRLASMRSGVVLPNFLTR